MSPSAVLSGAPPDFDPIKPMPGRRPRDPLPTNLRDLPALKRRIRDTMHSDDNKRKVDDADVPAAVAGNVELRDIDTFVGKMIDILQSEILTQTNNVDRLNDDLRDLLNERENLPKGMKEIKEVALDPRFHHYYDEAEGDICWDGPIKDGIDRGTGFEYFCPKGWTKIALKRNFDFDTKAKGWNIAYHGTSQGGVRKILCNSIKSSGCRNGGDKGTPRVYLSPCIEYCAHPTYASPIKLKDGSYVQVVFQCRVDPAARMAVEVATVLKDQRTVIDANYDNKSMEWLVKPPQKDDSGEFTKNLICYGVMMRQTKNFPDTLPQSQWWQACHSVFGDRNGEYGSFRNQQTSR